MLETILLIIVICIIVNCIVANTKSRYKTCYDQEWYKRAADKFGEDYYYPPSSSRGDLQSSGDILKYVRHYKPVRHSIYYPSTAILEPWFIEIFKNNNLIDRVFIGDNREKVNDSLNCPYTI